MMQISPVMEIKRCRLLIRIRIHLFAFSRSPSGRSVCDLSRDVSQGQQMVLPGRKSVALQSRVPCFFPG